MNAMRCVLQPRTPSILALRANVDKMLAPRRSVPAIVERVTGKKPSMELHPDEVVALGAAMQGAVLQAENKEGSRALQEQYSIVEIRDVCSHSMGVIASDDNDRDFNSIILRKDTAVPCEASEHYQTSVDGQTTIKVQVTEGEDEDPKFVKVRDERMMSLPAYKKGAPLRVTFRYDVNGPLRHPTSAPLPLVSPLPN